MIAPLPFQAAAIPHHIALLKSDRRASLEGSVAGYGKTFVAAFVAREMGHELVVLCPKVVIPHWREAAALVGARARCISNYEQHKLGHTGMGGWKIRNRQWQWTFPRPTLLVFDEAHWFKTRTSQNAKLMIAARRQGIPTMAMSATIAQDPLDFFALGYLLGLHSGDTHGFIAWASRYGVIRGAFDYEFSPRHDPTALDRLHTDLFPSHGHRKTYADIPGFPDELTDVLEVTGDAAKLRELETVWAQIAELELVAQEAQHAATERLRARQIAELAKVPAIVDLAKEYVANGQSVPVFVNFHQTIDALAAAFPRWAVIDGRHSKESYRAQAVADFQRDHSHGLIVQAQAGGVGISLHDTHGHRARHSIISPPESARDLIQILGRTRRVGGKSPAFRTILTLAASVEVKVRRKVQAKARQIETINDGDLDPLS